MYPAPSDTNFRAPPWVVALGRLIDRLGVGRSVSALVGMTVAGSLVLAYWMLKAYPPEWMYRGMVVNVCVAAGISGPVSFALCRLLADVSRSRATLRRIAHVDALTRASTRRHFMDRAPAALGQPRGATVIMIDIDHFKRVNDDFGHPAGDAVLRAVSDTCRSVLRGGDQFARLGGEEFVALLPGADAAAGARVAARMRELVAALDLHAPDGRSIPITASFGVARSGRVADPEVGLEELLGRADKALYQAKNSGRDRVHVDPQVAGTAPPDDAGAPAIEPSAEALAEALETNAEAGARGAASAAGPETFRSPRWIVVLGHFIERAGLVPATLCSVVGSTLAAAALTLLVMLAAGMRHLDVGLRFACTLTPIFSLAISWALFSLVADVSRARAILRQIAHIDSLTQAHTRRYFMDAAPDVLSRSRSTAIVLLDVDNFKTVNDRHGHATGDAVLRAVSDACRSALRGTDLFARYGGEEFVAVLPGVPVEATGAIVERMRRAVAALEIRTPAGEPLRVTASFGIAQRGELDPTTIGLALEDALGAADRALYEAKHRGKNRIEFDGPGLTALAPT